VPNFFDVTNNESGVSMNATIKDTPNDKGGPSNATIIEVIIWVPIRVIAWIPIVSCSLSSLFKKAEQKDQAINDAMMQKPIDSNMIPFI